MLKILDLFSGAGGFSCGLDSLEEFETVVAVDINEYALDTFKLNFKYADTLCGDIQDKEFKARIIEASTKKGVNMIIGGPPCQGFSNKGKKLGLDDPRNFLFLEYLDLVERLQPELFIIENVRTLLTASGGYFIAEIKSKIEALGYEVNYGVLNASEYGVPQARHRAFIIASRGKVYNFPEKHKDKVTIKDAIYDLAYLDSGEGAEVSEYKNEASSEYQKSMRAGSDKLYNHMATKHKDIAIKKLKLIPPECGKEYLPKELLGKQKFNTTWGRLEWDKVSPTIDTRFDTPANGKNSHPYLHRAITPREAARIQSFPDTFRFIGKKTYICRQIGNAVPPLLARAIGKAIIEQRGKK